MCTFKVRVKSDASRERVQRIGDNLFSITVKEPPEKNKANKRACACLAEWFGVPLQNVKIVKGHRTFSKICSVMFN